MVNNFTGHITNEEVSLLPAGQFGGRIIVVDKPGQIEAACNDLLSQPFVGFDTETRPSFKAGVVNRVALLQLSTHEKCYLFRLCKMPFDKMIIKVLTSKACVKIGADITNDLRALRAIRHFKPDGFVDLQNMVSDWGVLEKSVRKMSAIVLGERISKAQRLSNWEAAALTPAQQLYASTDAWICLRLYEKLMRTDKKPRTASQPATRAAIDRSPD